MNRLFAGLKELPKWLWHIARKWVWLIGLLPAALDILSTYVPGFPQISVPLYWAIGIGCVGLFISIYLVHLELLDRLAEYEAQEPLYEIQVMKQSAKACRADQIHIDCTFRIRRKNPWPGALQEISVADGRLPYGLGAGTIWRQEHRPLDWHNYNLLKFPYWIPPAGCDIYVVIHYPLVNDDLAERAKKSWERMTARLNLLTGYETQPVGYVQKCIMLDVPINLGEVFDEIARTRTEDT